MIRFKFNRTFFKEYFSNRENILVFTLLLILLTAGFILRIGNLGYLAFWGDDGATYASTEAVLKHGYPLLPSGSIMFHNILTYYVNAFFALIFGLNEFSLRFASVLASLLTVIITYFLGKELVNRYVGIFSAFVITFLNWIIEFSRQARYYSQFQAFFTATVLFFYLGFFKDKKRFKILAIIFLFLLGLVHDVGIFQISIFIPLLIYKGRKFFRRDVILGFFIVLAADVAQIINQIFFWKVGRSFYPQSRDIFSILATYVKLPQWKYFRILEVMYPDMKFVVFWGTIVFVLAGIVFSRKDEIFGKFNYIGPGRFKIYENSFYLYFILFFNILILELGQIVDQPRYLYFLMPVFVVIYVFILFTLAYMIYKLVMFIIGKILSIKNIKNNVKNKVGKFIPRMPIIVVLIVVFMIFSVNGINVVEAINIPKREYGQKINPYYSFSTTRDFHSDSKTPGLYVKKHMEDNDIIITMDIYNTYPYTGKIDYWLWTGTLTYWQPYHEVDGVLRDDSFGAVVIRNFLQLIDILNKNKDKNIWILTTPSIDIRVHIHPSISQFLKQSKDNLVYVGKDGISSVYLFGKDPDRKGYGVSNFISPNDENTINLIDTNDCLLDFTSKDSSSYLIFGWSVPEEGGTWAMSEKSYLYFNFSNKDSYKMIINAKPLYDPNEPLVVDLFLNGKKLESLVYTEDVFSKKEVIIDKNILDSDDNFYELEFRYSYNKRPIEVGIMNDDPRYLSLMVKSIHFIKILHT